MRYKPLPRSVNIGVDTLMVQAASTLDAASEVAETQNDVEGLLNVAAMWMKMAEGMDIMMQNRPPMEDESVKSSTIKTGFQKTDIIVEEEEND